MQKELANLIKARYSIIAVTSLEERRVTATIKAIGQSLGMQTFSWTLTSGFIGEGESIDSPDPQAAIQYAASYSSKAIFVLKDFHPYIKEGNPANVPVIRQLRDCAELLKNSPTHKTIILLCPTVEIPIDLKSEVALLDWPLPTEEELLASLKGLTKNINPKKLEGVNFEDIARIAKGLTLDAFEDCLAKSLITTGTIDKKAILDEKKSAISKDGLISVMEPEGGLNEVGGFDVLKKWLSLRAKAFSPKAKAYGLPSPKGVAVFGQSGCGKSLCAKSTAYQWNVILLNLDVGKIFSKFQGESEANLSTIKKIVESCAPCVLLVDEIDKGFGGADSSGGSTDGGTASRVLQGFLTWLQEKKSDVFVFVTANRIEKLPPELLRKGRFDELFYVDLPNKTERTEIWKIHIAKRKRNPEDFSIQIFVDNSEGFSGAEIESCIVDAMFDAFSDNEREFNSTDVLNAINNCVPLSKTASDKVEAMRALAKGRAKIASTPDINETKSRFENL